MFVIGMISSLLGVAAGLLGVGVLLKGLYLALMCGVKGEGMDNMMDYLFASFFGIALGGVSSFMLLSIGEALK